MAEIEKELRLQIERAIQTGLHIDYVDYHMGAAVETLEHRQLVERLAKEYGLAISRYFGEADVNGVYNAPPSGKLDTLLGRTKNLHSGGINLMVFHVGLQSPEMDALEDMNSFGLKDMSKHREAELRALISPQFRQLISAGGIHLTTYRELVREVGLSRMTRPAQ
jgi:hypothetical protein